MDQYITINSSGYFFIILVLALFTLVLWGLKEGLSISEIPDDQKKNLLRNFTVGLFIWVGLTAFFATTGYFRNFKAMPPKLLPALLLPLLFLGLVLKSKTTNDLLNKVPQTWLIGIQTFRIFMELILWKLYVQDIIPIQMTFEGRNFDILVGLSAPLVVYLLQKKKGNGRMVLLWNILGLLHLGNIVIVAILSAPTPFRVFMNEPANTVIGDFPFIWLPSFVVPVAYYMHALSIKKALREINN